MKKEFNFTLTRNDWDTLDDVFETAIQFCLTKAASCYNTNDKDDAKRFATLERKMRNQFLGSFKEG